jgi:tetratricopeptide (TPR) repeat protein
MPSCPTIDEYGTIRTYFHLPSARNALPIYSIRPDATIETLYEVIGMWTVFKRGEESAWVNRGFDLAKHGKFQEAIEAFEKALELNPRDVEGWLGKGIALASLDQHRQALECFAHIFRISPDYGEAWFHRAVSLAKLGHHDQAILCYDKALHQMQNDAWVWYRKGVSLEAMGEYRQAVDSYDKALALEESCEIREHRDGVLQKIRETTL